MQARHLCQDLRVGRAMKRKTKTRKHLTRLEIATLRFFDGWSLPLRTSRGKSWWMIVSKMDTDIAVHNYDRDATRALVRELNRAFAARDKRRKK